MSTATPVRTAPAPARRHGRTGAALAPPTIAYTVLTIAGLVVPRVVAGEGPWQSDAALLDFFGHHDGAARASAFFTFGAAIPLAVITAIVTTRLRRMGPEVPGRVIAQLGGVLAAAMLAVSGLTTFAITRPDVARSPGTVRGLYSIVFATGGPGFVVFTGLLLLGVSIVSLFLRLLPRWLAWAGIVIAAGCEVASVAVGFDALDALLPIGRFGSLAWLIALAVHLPSSRQELHARDGAAQ
jgi:hypothetical protein